MEGEKLEWIGYDACLMGVADIASTNADYFNYMVGSEELEGGYGWAYKDWLPTLYNNTSVSTPTLLDKVCKTFVDFYEDEDIYGSADNDSTLAAYDLSKMAKFTTDFDTWAANFTTESQFSTLKSKYESSMRFGDAYHNNDYYNSVVDIKDFLGRITSPSTTTLISDLDSVIISNYYGGFYSSSTKPCGMTLFFAGDESSYDAVVQTSTTDYTNKDTKFTNWRTFNLNYGEFLDSESSGGGGGWYDWGF